MKNLQRTLLALSALFLLAPALLRGDEDSQLGTTIEMKESDARGIVGNILCFLVTNSDETTELKKYTDDLAQEVIPGHTVSEVRFFNKFGEYLYGRDAVIAIPWLNYIVVNKDSFYELSDEARRFLIGRCLFALKHKHAMFWKGYYFSLITLGYASRSYDRMLDMYAAKELNAAAGGVEYFEKYKQFKTDGSFLGKLFTIIPIGWAVRFAFLGTILFRGKTREEQVVSIGASPWATAEQRNAADAISTPSIIRSIILKNLWNAFVAAPLSYTASRTIGSPVHEVSFIDHFICDLPILNCLTPSGDTDHRINDLRKVALEQALLNKAN